MNKFPRIRVINQSPYDPDSTKLANQIKESLHQALGVDILESTSVKSTAFRKNRDEWHIYTTSLSTTKNLVHLYNMLQNTSQTLNPNQLAEQIMKARPK